MDKHIENQTKGAALSFFGCLALGIIGMDYLGIQASEQSLKEYFSRPFMAALGLTSWGMLGAVGGALVHKAVVQPVFFPDAR